MRLKFVFAILSVVALAIIGIVFFKQHSSTPASPVTLVPVANVAPVPKPAPISAPVVAEKTMTPEERENTINAEKDKLDAWSMNNDPQSLSNILGDLTSPEKEIREAAIEAAKQFGDTNAIPVLKALAANDNDNQEAIEMLQAADFIALPSLALPTGTANPSGQPITSKKIQDRQTAPGGPKKPSQTSQSVTDKNSQPAPTQP